MILAILTAAAVLSLGWILLDDIAEGQIGGTK